MLRFRMIGGICVFLSKLSISMKMLDFRKQHLVSHFSFDIPMDTRDYL